MSPNSMKQPRDENGHFVTLRDFFEVILDEREKRYDERLANEKEALRLQAVEYERRLGELNNEYKRAATVQAKYVNIDKHDPEHERMNNDIEMLKGFRGKATLIAGGVALVSGTIGATVARIFGGG